MDAQEVTHDQFEVSTNTAPAADVSASLQTLDAELAAADESSALEPAPDRATTPKAPSPAEQRKAKIQDEINALVRQRGETQRERDAIAQELAALRAERDRAVPRPEPARQAPAPMPTGDERPRESDFTDYAEFTAAVGQWSARQAIREFQEGLQQRAEQEQRTQWETQRQQSFAERLADARQRIPQFDSLVNREDIELSPPMIDAIKDSPVAPDLMVHLAQHPDEAQRIYALHPVLAFGEMKALEGRLSAASFQSGSVRQTRSISQARPPIKPVGSAPSPSVDDPSSMEFGPEYVRRMNALDRRRRR